MLCYECMGTLLLWAFESYDGYLWICAKAAVESDIADTVGDVELAIWERV